MLHQLIFLYCQPVSKHCSIIVGHKTSKWASLPITHTSIIQVDLVIPVVGHETCKLDIRYQTLIILVHLFGCILRVP